MDGATQLLAPHVKLEQADPFDLPILATALGRNISLLTKDRQITKSGSVPVLW